MRSESNNLRAFSFPQQRNAAWVATMLLIAACAPESATTANDGRRVPVLADGGAAGDCLTWNDCSVVGGMTGPAWPTKQLHAGNGANPSSSGASGKGGAAKGAGGAGANVPRSSSSAGTPASSPAIAANGGTSGGTSASVSNAASTGAHAQSVSGAGGVGSSARASSGAPTPVGGSSSTTPTPSLDPAAHTLLDQITTLYRDEVRNNGRMLRIDVNTQNTDPDFSYAYVETGRIEVSLALIKASGVTLDVLASIVCHEVGLMLGGYPFQSALSATEGQADYFAGKECLPRLWKSQQTTNASFRSSARSEVMVACDGTWPLRADQDLCYRIARAAEDFAIWSPARRRAGLPKPTLAEYDSSAVSTTLPGLPSPQCRADTIFAGALCPTKFSGGSIPGLKQQQLGDGAGSKKAADGQSCQSGDGARPACWYASSDEPKTTNDCTGIPAERACDRDDKGTPGYWACDPESGRVFITCFDGFACFYGENNIAGCEPLACTTDISPHLLECGSEEMCVVDDLGYPRCRPKS